jgi:hypothetical protein
MQVHTTKAAVAGVSPVSGHAHGVTASVRRIVAAGGIRGFYAGFGASFFGAAPATCLYFTYITPLSFISVRNILNNAWPCASFAASINSAYDWFKRQSPLSANYPIAGELTSGFLAETLSCILWVPIDVVKERLQVQSLLLESRQNIHTTGAAATPAVTVATAAASASPSATPRPTVASSTTASTTQTPKGLIYRGNWHALVTIARHEGLRGIYRGYGATLLSYGPFSALYLSGPSLIHLDAVPYCY